MIFNVGDIVEAAGDAWPSVSLGVRGVVTSLSRTSCTVELLEPQQMANGEVFPIGYEWNLPYRNWRPIEASKPMTCVSLL